MTAYYDVGAEGQGTLTLETTGQVTMGYYTVPVGPPLNWDVKPFNQTNQSSGRCALRCFGATFAYSTVPYFTQNTPRSVTLLYNSNQTKPTPLVQLNVKKPTGSTPTEVWLQVKRSGAYQTFVNNETTLKFQPASGMIGRWRPPVGQGGGLDSRRRAHQ